ncbi:MAG TPA: hypothetical protein VE957_12725 [Terriglobales bacterium]|nr:hypothetical protein [Terriglobales bacterium]
MPSPRKLDLQSFLGSSVTEAVALGRKLKANSLRLTLILAVLAAVLMVSSPALLFAQSSGAGQNPSGEPEGLTSGGYLMHSSVEIGYRSNNVTGSGDMYDTLVNLQSGPRFLDQTLSMQSLDHHGVLFDDLYLNSFGWGGDPNNALRIRADKNKWYNFVGSFRRDQSFSDFDLLANPLNPPTSTPSIPALNSPHLFDTTRRMSDVDLTLLPQSRVSFRLGFSHNNMTGPSYSSVHEGTDALLLQDWNTTMTSYRFGADWRILPRTVLSYDQFLDYYKGDTYYQLASFAPALLSTGVPVELGLSVDTANSEPCAIKAPATSLINSNGVLTNNNCSAYFSYLRNQRMRTSTPTERLGLRSNYFQRLDLLASFSYSSADSNTPLDEAFNGLITRTFTRAFTDTGTASASRISDVLDLEATLHLTQHLRLIEKFYFWAYRIPENANFTEVDSDCTVHATCTLLTLMSATAPTTTPTLTQSSFNQTWKRNQTELAWDISKKVGARIGLRYGDRVFDHFNTFLAGGEDHFVVNEYTALLGFWARPTHALRLNFDLEHTNYDNVIVRMAPRKESRYRFQTTYTPRPWAVLGGSINILQDANADALTNYVGHNRNFGFTASLTPRERFGLDLAYNYNDVVQNALICFNDTPPTGVTLPFVTGATTGTGTFCTTNESANPLLNNSYYTNHTNFGMTAIRFKPEKRVTANVGYSVTSVDGSTPQFNFLQPLGSLQYKYQQPVANLSVDLGHKLAWNNGWNYYQYNEGSFVGPTAPRYFHANSVTESLRYAF